MYNKWNTNGINTNNNHLDILTKQTPLLSEYISNQNYKYLSTTNDKKIIKNDAEDIIKPKVSLKLNSNVNHSNENENENENANTVQNKMKKILKDNIEDPSNWGSSYWKMIHTMTASFDSTILPEQKNIYKQQIENLIYILPCIECRTNWKSILDQLPITDEVLENKYTFSKWAFDAHNLVNIHTSGITFSIQTFLKLYPNLRQGFIDHGYIELFTIEEKITQLFLVYIENEYQHIHENYNNNEKIFQFYKSTLFSITTNLGRRIELKPLKIFLLKVTKEYFDSINFTNLEKHYYLETFLQINEHQSLFHQFLEEFREKEQNERQQKQLLASSSSKKKCGCANKK